MSLLSVALLGLDPQNIRASIHVNPPTTISNEGSFLPFIHDPETPAAAGIYLDIIAEDFYSSEDESVAVVYHELYHLMLVGETDPEMLFLSTRQDADDDSRQAVFCLASLGSLRYVHLVADLKTGPQ